MSAGIHTRRAAGSFPERAAALLQRWPSIGLVLWIAALLRVASIFLLRAWRHPNAWEFGGIAFRIHAGLGFTVDLPHGGLAPSAYMPPAYPYILAWLLKVGGNAPLTWLDLELVQAASSVLLVYLIYRTALLLMPRAGAIAAAILTALYPSQVFMCNEFHPISFYITLGAAVVFFLTRCARTPAWRDLVAAAVCMGALLLFRAEATVLVLIYAALLLVRCGRRALPQAAAFILIAFLCLAPWTLRNLLAFGKLVPVTDSAGINLWIGNNPHATGSQHYAFPDFYSPALRRALAAVPQDRDYELNRDHLFQRDAEHFALTQPGAEARLMLVKLDYFFLYDPSHELGRRPLYWIPSVLLTLLALWGAFLRRDKLFRDDIFVVSSILFAVAICEAVFVLPRYKMVIDPFIMILAGSVVSHWLPRPADSRPTASALR